MPSCYNYYDFLSVKATKFFFRISEHYIEKKFKLEKRDVKFKYIFDEMKVIWKADVNMFAKQFSQIFTKSKKYLSK